MTADAIIFDIERFGTDDGPGIRTVVFVKGCPLQCRWCHNPESQSPMPELLALDQRCTLCGRCAAGCPNAAIRADASKRSIDRVKCDNCGLCVSLCSPKALRLAGERMTVVQVMEIVKRGRRFFETSGGGVTVSGGEPLTQERFVSELFALCRREGIHTVLDTCGYAGWDAFARVLQHTDFVLYDLKVLDSDAHRMVTGVDNRIILDNLVRLAGTGIELLVRVPIVPGLTDDPDNVRGIAGFVKQSVLPQAGQAFGGIELLPYHKMGSSKYRMIGRSEDIIDAEPPSEARMEQLARIVTELGLKCITGKGV